MPSLRHLIFAAVSVVAFALAVVAGVAGITLCSPPALPGDELWAWRSAFQNAWSYVLGGPHPGCYRQGAGQTLLAFSRLGLWLAAVGFVLWVLWELVWRPLRRQMLRRNGAHAILYGDLEDVRAMTADQRKKRPIAIVAPDRREGWRIANVFPWAEVLSAKDTNSLIRNVDQLGGSKASVVAAISKRDLENIALAEHLLLGSAPSAPNMALRVEQNVVRTMRSQPLQEAADRRGAKLTVFSLSMLTLRAGVHEAMPGRFLIDGSNGYHAAICGSGPMVSQLAFLLARQGYWMEQSVPRLSIMRTGFRDFAPGQIERLSSATLAANVVADHVDPDDVASFERAASSIATAEPPLHAIHCVGESAAEALALAQRWERVLLALRLPIPPIVTYGPASANSASGMIRLTPQFDPRDASHAMRLADSRARAVHEDYLQGQRAAKKDDFGKAPAEVEWDRLAENFRDDNRNTADHIEYKLARVGLRAVASPDVKAFRLDDAAVKLLGRMEHARWMAAKNIAGFQYGPKRDDRERIHPDLLPFEELSEAAQDKDYDVVRAIPKMLALGSQQVERVTAPKRGANNATAIAEITVSDPASIATATSNGGEYSVSIGPMGRDLLAGGDAVAAAVADLLRGAYQIRHLQTDEQPEGIKQKEKADA